MFGSVSTPGTAPAVGRTGNFLFTVDGVWFDESLLVFELIRMRKRLVALLGISRSSRDTDLGDSGISACSSPDRL